MQSRCYDGATIHTRYDYESHTYVTEVTDAFDGWEPLDWMPASEPDPDQPDDHRFRNGQSYLDIEEDDDRVAEMHRDAWRTYHEARDIPMRLKTLTGGRV